MTRFIVTAVLVFGTGCSGAEPGEIAEDLGSTEQALNLGTAHQVIPALQGGFAMCPYGEVLVGVVYNRADRIACAQSTNLRTPGSWTVHNRAANGTASCSTAGTLYQYYSEVAVGWNSTTGALRCSVTWPNAVNIDNDSAGSEVTQLSQLNELAHRENYIDFGPQLDEIGLCQYGSGSQRGSRGVSRAIVDLTRKSLPVNGVTYFQTCAQ